MNVTKQCFTGLTSTNDRFNIIESCFRDTLQTDVDNIPGSWLVEPLFVVIDQAVVNLFQ